jgi:hypothetical protein
MDRLGRRQLAFNTTSRHQWEPFAEHRRCLTAALARGATAGRTRLCVLGAGNGNDLDLTALLSAHREVHLADIDDEALARGAERQGVARHPRLHLHGGVELTATLGLLADRTPLSGLAPADLDAMATRILLPGHRRSDKARHSGRGPAHPSIARRACAAASTLRLMTRVSGHAPGPALNN